MRLKIKRFQHIEDLLAESAKIVDDQSKSATADWIDDLLDRMVGAGIEDIRSSLAKPENRVFLDKEGLSAIEGYLQYCESKSNEYSNLLKQELAASPQSMEMISALQAKLAQLSERIIKIEEIYTDLNASQPDEAYENALQQAERVKLTVQNNYINQYAEVAEKIKTQISEINRERDPETKKKLAEDFLGQIEVLRQVIAVYPEDYKETIEQSAIEPATEIVKKEVGEQTFSEIQTNSNLNKEETDIVRRILDLQNINFESEAQIKKEVSNIRIKINSLREHTNVKRKASSEETIAYLENMLLDAEEWLLKKASEKSINLSSMKGIHFDFNKKLKLYEVTDLPVTGKQIADESVIMKLRKGLTNILSFLFPGEVQLTPAGQAFANLGSMVHNIYATVLNNSAKTIGKVLKGREGEIKGDAISRMFIPNTGYLDAKEKAVNENSASPGLAAQVPGSIGGMGPIVPPTPTSLGSGDNFNASKKKKSTKKKRILEFSEFINQNNH